MRNPFRREADGSLTWQAQAFEVGLLSSLAEQVIALVDQGADNQRIVDDLDALVSRIVQGLVLDYSVSADAYETITFPNQQPYLGCRITIESGIWNLT
mgnify:CR=1 FL=1